MILVLWIFLLLFPIDAAFAGQPVALDASPLASSVGTAVTAVLKNGPGFAIALSAGAAACTVYDANTIAGATPTTAIGYAGINSTAQIRFLFSAGLTVGGAGPCSVSYQ